MATGNYTNDTNVATFVLNTTAPYSILDFDQGLCIMTGYSPREVSKKMTTLDALVYADDFTDTIASINYQLSISNLVSFQCRIGTKNGALLTVLCNGQAVTLPDGRDALQCVFTDITNLEKSANESVQAKTDLEIFANTVPSGVSKHRLDNNLTLTWANDYFYKLCDTDRKSFKEKHGKNALSIVYTEDLALVVDAIASLNDNTNSLILNFRIQADTNSIKWVNAVFARSGETDGSFPVVNLVLSDITNLKIAETKAMLEEQKYLIISDISEELPYEYDIKEDTIIFADKFNNIFEGTSVIKNPAEEIPKMGLVSYDTTEALTELFYLAKTGTEFHQTEFKLNTKNGGFQWYFTTFSTIYDENDVPLRVVGLLRNIHAQKTEQQELLERAETDLMTGLLNKATTENKIHASLRRLTGNSYNVFMLVDIDDFKKINDTYGHLKGDEVICAIADTMKKYTTEYDLAGRLGGDEFCMFFSNLLDVSVATEKAERIATELKEMFPGDETCNKVTLSIGVAATKDQIPYSVLLENADTALYDAKLRGKDCYVVYKDNMERGHYENLRSTEPENKIADENIEKLLSTLFSNNNSYQSIGKALDIIGNSVNVDKIRIFEYGYSKNYVDCTHEWIKTGVSKDTLGLEHLPSAVFEEISSYGSDGVYYTSDTSSIKLHTSNMHPISDGIKRIMQIDIKSSGKIVGYLCFISMSEDCIWNSETLSKFKTYSSLISEAICAKRNEQTLTHLRDETISVFDIIQNPMIVVDKDNYEIMYFNETAKENYPGLTLNTKCYSCMYQSSTPCLDCVSHKLAPGKSAKCTKVNQTFGEMVDVHMTPINWSQSSNAFLISTSAHKQTKAEKLKLELEQNINIEKKVEEASYRDIITGYGNFEKFKVEAAEILEENPSKDFVMFYFNVRNFKYINETYGHSIGDRTLKTIAEVLHKHLRSRDTFARVIGDTYIMMIENRQDVAFLDTFNNIKHEVHDACIAIQDKFSVDFSTGILIIDQSMREYDVNKLIDRAIMAGKSVDANPMISYAFYDDSHHKEVLNEAQIENSMINALKNGEFCAYVQPKYNIANNNLVGGELLVRWMSPSKGFLEPATFIPTFEKNGFIYQIDCFMLEEACKSLRRYLDNDIYVLPFSVNLSRVTLSNPSFIPKVFEIVEKYYIPHHYIEFEVTESIFSEDYSDMISTLRKLKDADFVINMDDFGTGYSSLTLLQDLPVEVLKLDHDFLLRSTTAEQDAPGSTEEEKLRNANAIQILRSIIDMAHALDIRVVSEGIESVEQLEMLKSLNCEIGQGYIFAKPMPIDDYDKLMKNYSLGNVDY